MGHTHAQDLQRGRSRALWISLVANGGFAVAEVAGGLIFGSLALLADAAHMIVDVGALGIALIAQRLLTRPASARHTYGLQRAEVLGGLVNGILIVVVSISILIEALQRLDDPQPVIGTGVIVVAGFGLLVNLVSAALIARSAGPSVNMRGALIHMLADAAGSVAAIAAGIAAAVWGAYWVDPAAGLATVGLLGWAVAKVLLDAVHVLMEGVPKGMDAVDVERSLVDDQGVEGVHHLHLWNLASDVPALSAHVVLQGEVTLHEAQVCGERLKSMLVQRFGIEHATLELECHACDSPSEAAALQPSRDARGL